MNSAFWLAVAGILIPVAAACAALIAIQAAQRRDAHARADTSSGRGTSPEAGDALEEARQEARRARRLLTIGSILDLEPLLEHVLTAAIEACGGDAAAVALDGGRGPRLVKTTGLRRNEDAPTLPGRGEATAPSILVQYQPSQPPSPSDYPIRTGLFVRLVDEDHEQLGTVAVYWRRILELDASNVDVLEELAGAVAPAIQNAQRFEEARHLAVVDGVTGLYNRRYFDEALQREVTRAHRYDRPLALLLLDLDGFKAVNDEIGHLAGDAVLAEFADCLRSAVRAADIACRIGGDEFAVLLPEADELDARHLEERVQAARASHGGADRSTVTHSSGIAQLRPGEEAAELVDRADQELLRRKRMRGSPQTPRQHGAKK